MNASDTSPLVELRPSLVGALERTALVIAVVAAAISFLGRRYGWLDYRPGGAAFDVYISPIFIGLLVAAALVAIKSPIVGGAVALFATGGLVAFATKQLEPLHAAGLVALFAIPGALWLFVALAELSRHSATLCFVAVAAVGIGGFVVGTVIYDRQWGPTHPSSDLAALPDSPVEWMWSGAVTTSGGEVRARLRSSDGAARLAVSTSPDFSDPTMVEPGATDGTSEPIVAFVVDGLSPATTYHYAIEVDGALDEVRIGEFTTFAEGAASFRLAVGACARVGSNGAVFDTIRETDPLMYLILGDFHYGDNGVNDLERYRDVMDVTLTRPAQSALYRDTPVAYMWDDHDYGPNDADGNSPSRQAAMRSYREHVPSYELGGEESAVYQSFSIGRVRFVLTDARSARNLDRNEEAGATSMLGAEQLEWFKDELIEASRTHELVVWVNPVPWVADAREGADHWGGFPDERRELADHIADNRVDNLLMISGDAHMVAIDDGTNTDYSTNGWPGFPLLHSAALDRPGGEKGGPYSEGAIGGSGQFATIDVADDGDDVVVTLTALDWEGTELLSHEFSTADTTGSPTEP